MLARHPTLPKLVLPLIALFAGAALVSTARAQSEVILSYPELPGCDAPLVPLHVYTIAGDGDYHSLAQAIEREQEVGFLGASYVFDEQMPFVIFVDLIQSHHGGLVAMDVMDSQGNVTWEGLARVPPFRERMHLERHVIPWEIAANQVDLVFPRSDVYRVRAFPRFLEETAPGCSFEASTSLLVVAQWE